MNRYNILPWGAFTFNLCNISIGLYIILYAYIIFIIIIIIYFIIIITTAAG